VITDGSVAGTLPVTAPVHIRFPVPEPVTSMLPVDEPQFGFTTAPTAIAGVGLTVTVVAAEAAEEHPPDVTATV